MLSLCILYILIYCPFFLVIDNNLLSIDLVNFFNSASSIFDMVEKLPLLFVGLLYCYIVCHFHINSSSWWAIDFSLRFRTGLESGHSMNLLFCKSFIHKEFMGKFIYIKRRIVVHKYTIHFETARLRLLPC